MLAYVKFYHYVLQDEDGGWVILNRQFQQVGHETDLGRAFQVAKAIHLRTESAELAQKADDALARLEGAEN